MIKSEPASYAGQGKGERTCGQGADLDLTSRWLDELRRMCEHVCPGWRQRYRAAVRAPVQILVATARRKRRGVRGGRARVHDHKTIRIPAYPCIPDVMRITGQWPRFFGGGADRKIQLCKVVQG